DRSPPGRRRRADRAGRRGDGTGWHPHRRTRGGADRFRAGTAGRCLRRRPGSGPRRGSFAAAPVRRVLRGGRRRLPSRRPGPRLFPAAARHRPRGAVGDGAARHRRFGPGAGGRRGRARFCGTNHPRRRRGGGRGVRRLRAGGPARCPAVRLRHRCLPPSDSAHARRPRGRLATRPRSAPRRRDRRPPPDLRRGGDPAGRDRTPPAVVRPQRALPRRPGGGAGALFRGRPRDCRADTRSGSVRAARGPEPSAGGASAGGAAHDLPVSSV
ncbi:MAG: hypothetical protein AVDCRST_MAG59-1670, partial [uncultured Thermomicrobiales bacterium]